MINKNYPNTSAGVFQEKVTRAQALEILDLSQLSTLLYDFGSEFVSSSQRGSYRKSKFWHQFFLVILASIW